MSNHCLTHDRVKFKLLELQKMERIPVYKELVKSADFQTFIMKSHWVNKMSLNCQGISSSIFDQPFDLSMTIERVVNP